MTLETALAENAALRSGLVREKTARSEATIALAAEQAAHTATAEAAAQALRAEQAAHAATVARMQRFIDEAVANHRIEQEAHFLKAQEYVALKAEHESIVRKFDPEIKAAERAALAKRRDELRAEADTIDRTITPA